MCVVMLAALAVALADPPAAERRMDELFPQFTHGDVDLEQRYRTRVKDLVKFAFQEMTGSG